MANGDSFLGAAGTDLSNVGTGLTKILSNPLAQLALGTYFGTISSPRRLGWGTALGQGGLAGLNQFAQAEQYQAELPKLQAEIALDVTKAQQAQQQLAGQQQLLDWLDKDPAAQKMDPSQRMILRMAASGVNVPAGTFISPYQQAQLAQGSQRLGIEGRKATAEERKSQADTLVAQEKAAGTLPATPESPDLAAERQAATQLNQERFRQLQAGVPQLAKVNIDLGRFSQSNPIHFYTNTTKWVNDAVKYATNLNPGVDPNEVRQSAEALARVPGTTPTSNAPTAAHGPNPTATGPGGQKIQWNGTAWVPMGG